MFSVLVHEQLLRRVAALPLSPRRILFRCLWGAAGVMGRAPRINPPATFEECLRVPAADAAQLALHADFCNVLALIEWAAFKYRSLESILADMPATVTTGDEVLLDLSGEDRSIIFAPLHMGAYVAGMALMIERYFRKRRVLILVSAADDIEMQTTLARIGEVGCEVRLMNVRDPSGYVDAVRFARKNAVVICFVDLPATYGLPVDVELFGRPARLGMGIDQLAAACNAVVVPIACYSHLTSERIAIGGAFEVGRPGPDERARVARMIRRHIETSILAAPEQWHMWPRVGEYFLQPEAVSAS